VSLAMTGFYLGTVQSDISGLTVVAERVEVVE
jgi:hypothetical protein